MKPVMSPPKMRAAPAATMAMSPMPVATGPVKEVLRVLSPVYQGRSVVSVANAASDRVRTTANAIRDRSTTENALLLFCRFADFVTNIQTTSLK